MTLKLNEDNLKYTELEIYIKYGQLDNRDVVELLSALDRLYNDMIGHPFSFYFRGTLFPEFFYPFKNILEVRSIETGQSIKFGFKEGWKPNIRIRDKELEIDVPKNIGIPIIIIYLLLLGTQKVVDLRNKSLDNELKQLEIKMKEIELYQKIKEQKKAENNHEDLKRLQRQADRTIEFLKYNRSINYVEVNGIIIKSEKSN